MGCVPPIHFVSFTMYKPLASLSVMRRLVVADVTCLGTGGSRSLLQQCRAARTGRWGDPRDKHASRLWCQNQRSHAHHPYAHEAREASCRKTSRSSNANTQLSLS